MLERVKFSLSSLLGLALGICLALPLFWVGVKHGVASLRKGALNAFEPVERRQQAMADEALKLEVLVKNKGLKLPKADFAKIELLRSRLAGSGDFGDKIELSQDLERALVNVETLYAQLMKQNAAAAKSPFLREFGMNWMPMKRYLVDEEFHFSAAVREYNRVLLKPPLPFIIGHKSFAALLGSLATEVHQRAWLYLKQGWAWLKYLPRWVWAVSRGNSAPEMPAALPHRELGGEALYEPLPEPFYIAEAPVPEEDYAELQYNRDAPDMADVEVGQQKAVRDNAASKPYVAPVPTVQRTATY